MISLVLVTSNSTQFLARPMAAFKLLLLIFVLFAVSACLAFGVEFVPLVDTYMFTFKLTPHLYQRQQSVRLPWDLIRYLTFSFIRDNGLAAGDTFGDQAYVSHDINYSKD